MELNLPAIDMISALSWTNFVIVFMKTAPCINDQTSIKC